ncbi:hypothetical protein D3C76_1765550 [compost metagenome]
MAIIRPRLKFRTVKAAKNLTAGSLPLLFFAQIMVLQEVKTVIVGMERWSLLYYYINGLGSIIGNYVIRVSHQNG